MAATSDKNKEVKNPSTTGGSLNDEQRAKEAVKEANDARPAGAEGADVASYGNEKHDGDDSLLPAADNTAPSAIKAREDAGKAHLNG